jgi:phospholipid transport system substrate-binding protein
MHRGLLGGLLMGAAAFASAAGAPAPTEIVGAFHAALIDAMRNGKTLGCEQRIERLAPVVRSTFEIHELARLVMRRHWARLSPDQRQQFTAALEQLIVTTYASQFNDYGGETFGTPVAQELPAGRRKVHTTLNHPPDAPVSFDYVLQPAPGGWRVINVLADGISDLALRSAQYDSVMKNEGFDKLLADLKEQAAKNRTGC